MEMKNLKKGDNYVICKLVINSSIYSMASGTIRSLEYLIGEEVMFTIRVTMLSMQNGSKNTQIFIKFSRKDNSNYEISVVKLHSKTLNLNKEYTVDDSEWRLIHEVNNTLNLEFDLMFQIDQSFEEPQYFLSFAPLYEDTALTDFELQGDDGSIQIHGAALAASSPALRRMLEGKWKETEERTLKMPQTSKATLQHLKNFIYLGILPETGLEKLFLLASCYMLDDLKKKCMNKLVKSLKADNAIAISRFALENNFTNLYLSVLEAVEKGWIKVSDIKLEI